MDSQSREEFFKELHGKYAGTTVIYRHNTSADRIGIFDADLVDKLPESVKWIGHNGAGYDQIDVDACKKRGKGPEPSLSQGRRANTPIGIKVSNTPGAVDDGTATTALYLLVSAVRQYSIAERQARSGLWKRGLKPAHDPSALTLGILGLGGIGMTLARFCHGFPMKQIYYYSRTRRADTPDWIQYCSTLEELLAKSDVLSLHVPLRPDTEGMIGEREFGLMKNGAILINTARGKVIDEAAMIRALKSGQVRYGAGAHTFHNLDADGSLALCCRY